MSTDIHDTGAIPRVSDTAAEQDAVEPHWHYDTLPEAVKPVRETPLFMDAPPQEAEAAPVVVPVSYPSSDADSFFDRTWFETGAIDVSEIRGMTEMAEAEPMRVDHVVVTPSVSDPIAAGLAIEQGMDIPESVIAYEAPEPELPVTSELAPEPAPVMDVAERPLDERPVFERPIYEPVVFGEDDNFFVTAPVVGTQVEPDFDPSLFSPRETAAPVVTAEALAASYEAMDVSAPEVDRTSGFESYYSDTHVPDADVPAYSAESPGDAWYIEPPFVKGEGVVPVGGTPSRWGKLLVPIALGAVSIMALIAGWAHFQNSNTDTNVVVAPTNKPAASSAPPVVVVPDPVASSEAPSIAPVVPDPAASSVAPVVPVVPAGDRSVPVVVLNGTGTKGLATKVADDLRAKGWKVVSVGNYPKGSATQTTVYSPGPRTASATMRKDVPQASLTHKPLPGMSSTQITLVIGSDYQE